jgi:hypothetical protein
VQQERKASVDGDEKRSSLISSIFGSQHGFYREFIKRQKTFSLSSSSSLGSLLLTHG